MSKVSISNASMSEQSEMETPVSRSVAAASATVARPSLTVRLVNAAADATTAPAPAAGTPVRRGKVGRARQLLLRGDAEAVDYRQRMIVNFAALFFVLFLTGTGVWLATTIRDLRRTQACLLAVRPDCPRTSPTATPPPGLRLGERFGDHG